MLAETAGGQQWFPQISTEGVKNFVAGRTGNISTNRATGLAFTLEAFNKPESAAEDEGRAS